MEVVFRVGGSCSADPATMAGKGRGSACLQDMPFPLTIMSVLFRLANPSRLRKPVQEGH